LGFAASVTPDGKLKLSPKGTTTYWDDDHLIFADLCSPGTAANLRHNPAVEINVVNWFARQWLPLQGHGAGVFRRRRIRAFEGLFQPAGGIRHTQAHPQFER